MISPYSGNAVFKAIKSPPVVQSTVLFGAAPSTAEVKGKSAPVNCQPSVVKDKNLENISFLRIGSIFWDHLKNNQNKEVGIAFAQKYGSNFLFPAFFSIPVVGWLAGPLLMPFAGYISNRGEKQLQAFMNDKQYDNHPAIKAEHLLVRWNDDKTKLDNLKDGYNEFISALFPEKRAGSGEACPDSEKLRKRFTITNSSSKGYKRMERLFNAKKALDKSILGWLLKPLDWISSKLNNVIKLPKAITGILLIPRYALLAIFYALGKKP